MKKSLLIAGAAALLVGVAAFAPASLLQGTANRALADAGEMKQLTGTVWSGAGIVSLKASGGRIDVPVKWSWAPSSLARARMGFDITASGREIAGDVRVEAGLVDVQFRRADIRASMAALGRLSRNIGFARPSGDLRILTGDNSVTVGYAAPHTLGGGTRLTVSNVRLQGLGGLSLGTLAPPLGSYEGTVNFAGQRIDFKIDKSSGLLGLAGGGNIVLGPQRSFQYQGFASMLPGSPVWLMSSFASLGKATPDGRFNIDIKTNW